MGEFSHHPGSNPDGCCLFTLCMLLGAASLIVGAVVAGIWAVTS